MLLAAIASSDDNTTQPNSVATVSLGTPQTLLALREPRLLTTTSLDASRRFVTNANPTWTSSNNATGSVDQQGNLLGVSLGGPVTITVTAGGNVMLCLALYVTFS